MFVVRNYKDLKIAYFLLGMAQERKNSEKMIELKREMRKNNR